MAKHTGAEPYHYTQCGLSNVFLSGGVTYKDSPYGRTVHIANEAALLEEIGRLLIKKAHPLTGEELRYLRTELDLSQKRLGELLGKTAQSVASWEKADTVPEHVNFLMRHIYSQAKGGRQSYVELVEELQQRDQSDYNELCLKPSKEDWQVA